MSHANGLSSRKLHRERDQRTALMRGLARSLVLHQSIETTYAKAKEVVPFMERLITKAKKGDLHNRRQIISTLGSIEASHKLVDELAPKLTHRSSGHLRVERTSTRRGDNAQLARVSFVDDFKEAPVAKSAEKAVVKKEAAKTPAKPAAKAQAKGDK